MNNSNNIAELLTITNNKLRRGYSIAAIEKELKFGKDTLRRKLNRAGYRYSKNDRKFILNNNAEMNNKSEFSKPSNSDDLRNEHNNNTSITQNIIQTKEPEKNTFITPNVTQTKEPAASISPAQNITKIEQYASSTSVTQPMTGVRFKEEHKENTSVTQNTVQTKSNNIDSRNNTKIAQVKKFTAEDISILFKLIENYKLKEKKDSLNYEKDENDVITRSVRSYRNVLDNFSNFCRKHNLSQKDALADALMLFMRSKL